MYLSLGYTTAHDVIELKGRVACEISTGDELLLTELIFNGAFNALTVEQTVALLSCFVFEEKVTSPCPHHRRGVGRRAERQSAEPDAGHVPAPGPLERRGSEAEGRPGGTSAHDPGGGTTNRTGVGRVQAHGGRGGVRRQISLRAHGHCVSVGQGPAPAPLRAVWLAPPRSLQR